MQETPKKLFDAQVIDIISGKWLINLHEQQMAMLASKIINCEAYDKEAAKQKRQALLPDYYAVSDTNLSYQGKDRKAAMPMNSNGKPQDRIVVINIRGALTKYDQFSGGYGLMTYAQQIEQAYNDNSVAAIVLNMDTPGGSVAGTEIVAQMVARKDKPVVVFANELLCSAGYWIAAQSDYIIASGQNAEVGSIGGMVSFWSSKELDAEWGIVTVYATQSKHKNEGIREYDETGETNIIQKEIDAITANFISQVKAKRGDVINSKDYPEVYMGRTYLGSEAVKTGLVDKIGTFNDAIKKAAQLAKQRKNVLI
jgi:signal peptide peptidase SppA